MTDWRVFFLSLILLALPLPVAATDTNVVTDSFERKDLGSNWTKLFGNPGIVNRSDMGIVSGGFSLVGRVAPAFTPDQFNVCTTVWSMNPIMRVQVFVRRRASDAARYGFHWNSTATPVPQWEIKYDGVPTAQTRLLATTSDEPGLGVGDVLRIEVAGSPPTIRGYRNGAVVLEASDTHADQIASGQPGMAFSPAGGVSVSRSPVCESWSGGTYAP